MARTPSTMLPLGTQAPAFSLSDGIEDQKLTFADVSGVSGTLVMFICNHCPYVIHIMDVFPVLEKACREHGIGFVAINSNDVENYPQDSPEKMRELKREKGWGFPFLFDASQDVAHAFKAACTPDFYLFNGENELVYRGQLDASRPGNEIPVTGEDLLGALEKLVSGASVVEEQRPSLGCNIKWREGNEPAYFPA